MPSTQPDELDLGEPDVVAEAVLGHQVLRQALHQQQRDPAEHPHDRQQDLVGPPAGQDLGEVGGEQGREVDDQALRVVRGRASPVRPSRRATRCRRPGPARRGRAAALEPARARAGSGRGRGAAPADGRGAAGVASRRSCARLARAASGPGRSAARRRTRSARRPPTRRPLMYVPLVLPRSSTYQPRPRNVRTACSADANGSSTTIELLTSRPSVVMASSANDMAGRRLAGWATRRRPGAPAGPPAHGPPPAGRAAASGRPGTGTGRAERGTGAGRPTGRAGSRPSVSRPGDLDHQHRVADLDAGRRSRGRPRSPASPLTRDPFVLPRSE